MMLKYAGIILVSGGISMLGYHKAFKIRENILIRKALYEFVLYIKSCIDTSGTALNTIYLSYSDETLEKTGFLQLILSENEKPFEYALTNARLFLPDSLKKIYLSLAACLGKSRSGKSETELLSRYISLIEKQEEKLIKNDESKIQLYRKLGILTGILAAIVFV